MSRLAENGAAAAAQPVCRQPRTCSHALHSLCSIKTAAKTTRHNNGPKAMWRHGAPACSARQDHPPRQHLCSTRLHSTHIQCSKAGCPLLQRYNFSRAWTIWCTTQATRTWPLGLLKHMPTLLVEHRVDATQRLLRGLDLNEVDRLAQPRPGCELRGVQGSPAGGDDLATTPVDGVCMEDHVAHLQGGE